MIIMPATRPTPCLTMSRLVQLLRHRPELLMADLKPAASAVGLQPDRQLSSREDTAAVTQLAPAAPARPVATRVSRKHSPRLRAAQSFRSGTRTLAPTR